jgi:uncharacterized protein (UPF0147 family)
MDFIREIHEARMTRSESNTRKLTYRDCCERAYLSLLILELLRQFPEYERYAKKYARETSRHTGYDHFRMNAPDLYNFLYFIQGDEEDMQKLKDPDAAWNERQRTQVPIMAVNRYLSKIAQGQKPQSPAQFLMKLESAIQIKAADYKVIRRTITNLDRLRSARDLKRAVTKLLYAARARLRSADIIDELEKIAADRNLEKSGVKDTQPTLSRPDTELTGSELLYLARIVGQRKLPLALKYIELSAKGKTIPSNVSQAFNPAIELLIDIIKGGGSYVARLKLLQREANKQRKRSKR